MATNKPAPKKQPGARAPKKQVKKSSGRPAGLFTWLLVGVVVIAVGAIVIVKISSKNAPTNLGVTPQAMVAQITGVPQSVFDTVGVTSEVQVQPLPKASNQALLKWPDSKGVTRPTIYYEGAEYCPFCAAERWPMIVSLSRFGTFTGLYNMLSASSPEVYPNTPTFTFLHATYTSKYINFFSVETEDRNHNPLQTPTSEQQAVFSKFNSQGSIPFVTIGNQAIVIGAEPSPSALEGATREQIASALIDPTVPLTQGIIASSNYISASICHIDGQMPTNVCTSSGVKAADTKMGY